MQAAHRDALQSLLDFAEGTRNLDPEDCRQSADSS